MERIASATVRPCAVSTSTCRSFATVSSAVCLFLLILSSSFGSKAIHQGGPLFRGQTSAGLPPYVIHGLCNFPGLMSLLGEGVRRQAAERRMWSGLIVISPPAFDSLPCIGHG